MTPDVYCPCGCRFRYDDDDGNFRCCACRELLCGANTSCNTRGPYLRDSDWMGKGPIVEFLMNRYKAVCNELMACEEISVLTCVRCGGWQYRLNDDSVCWSCRKKEATDDDGC